MRRLLAVLLLAPVLQAAKKAPPRPARPQVLCVRGMGDGFGSQTFSQMTAVAYCLREETCCYKHTAIRTIAHPYTALEKGANATETPQFLAAFKGFASTAGCENRAKCDTQIHSYEGMREVARSSEPDLWFTQEARDLMYGWYAAAPHKPKKVDKCDLAVHVRRGDVTRDKKFQAFRYVDDERYLKAIENALSVMHGRVARPAGVAAAPAARPRVCVFSVREALGSWWLRWSRLLSCRRAAIAAITIAAAIAPPP